MRRLIPYLLVVSWMAVIFFASTEAGSPQHTSRILVPLLKWLKPDIAPETLKLAQTIVRKAAHLSEYGILGLLMWLGRKLDTRNFREWNWKEIAVIIAICGVYAATDELHQYFVETRTSSVGDVFIDTIGASIALCVLYFGGKLLRIWKQNKITAT